MRGECGDLQRAFSALKNAPTLVKIFVENAFWGLGLAFD
jgi:hypothetical protein